MCMYTSWHLDLISKEDLNDVGLFLSGSITYMMSFIFPTILANAACAGIMIESKVIDMYCVP